jgi:chaperonin GroES
MLRPIQDYVIIKELPKEQDRIGDIVIPPTGADKKPILKGKVLATGPGLITNTGVQVPNETKEGDIVLFSAFTQKFKHEGEDVYALREGSVLAVIG